MALALDQQAVNEIVVTTVLFTLATVIIALRFIVRRILRNSLDVSDWLTAISWSILLALFVQIVLWAAIGGDGEEMKDVSPPTMTRFFKVISSIGLSAGQAAHLTQIFYANMITYFVLAPCIKLSLVFFFRSLFPIRNFRIATNIVASLISTWGVAIILVGIFQCTPIDTFWHPSNGGVCIDLMAFLYGVQYPNIIFDFTLLFMPVPVIWNIQRPTREKVALTGIFTLGGIGCVSGIVRVIVLGYLESSNLTYTAYQGTIWTLVEPCVALICGSLPIIRGFLKSKRRSTRKKPQNLDLSLNSLRSRASKAKSTPLNTEPDYEMGRYQVMVSHEVSVVSE